MTLQLTDIQVDYGFDSNIRLDGCALHGVHLFDRGTVYALTGSNGSGKSTLLKALCGTGSINVSGSCRISRKDFAHTDLRPTSINEHLNLYYQPQITRHGFPSDLSISTVFECWLAFAKLRGGWRIVLDAAEAIDEVIKNVTGATMRVASLLESKRYYRCGSLSGGEMEAVSLVLMDVLNADLYLLDEPTAAASQVNSSAYAEVIAGIARQREAFIIAATHDTNLISVSTEVKL